MDRKTKRQRTDASTSADAGTIDWAEDAAGTTGQSLLTMETAMGVKVANCIDEVTQYDFKIRNLLLRNDIKYKKNLETLKDEFYESAKFHDLVAELKEYYENQAVMTTFKTQAEETENMVISLIKTLGDSKDALEAAIKKVKEEHLSVDNATEVAVDDLVNFAGRLAHFSSPTGAMCPLPIEHLNSGSCLLYNQEAITQTAYNN